MIFKQKNESDRDVKRHAPRRDSKFQWIWFSPVDLAGEFLDLVTYWRRTRRWRAILAIVPVIVLVLTLGSFVAMGQLAVREDKVTWYADLANEKIALSDSLKTDSNSSKQVNQDESVKRMPEVIDMLFRRVLQLNQNNKFARFYVASQMTRYGSRGSARQIMESLAPSQGVGYQKAHAWLAMDLIERSQKGEAINFESLKHHLKRGTAGDDVPPALLIVYSQLLQQENKTAESQEILRRAAEYDPKLLLSSIANYSQNGLTSQAKATADMLVEKVKDKWTGEHAEENLVLAAQAYVLTNRIDNAIGVLQTGAKRLPQSHKLARAMSDAYRLKFRASSTKSDNKFEFNLDFLNAAIVLDPTNITVQDELNALSQFDMGQSEATVDALRAQIATTGTSFAARLLLAESSFRRGDLASAINDYEVVLAELPRMTLALNKLAMMYSLVSPSRLEESLQLIDRAIAISPGVPEFHDSRGDILSALKRTADAVASYLVALEGSPQRIQTREKVIALYEELSQKDQAQAQRDKLAEIQLTLEEQRKKTTEATREIEKAVPTEKSVEESTEKEKAE